MTFTSTKEVRTESGFENNQNVSEQMIYEYREQSYNEVLSIASNFYQISYFMKGSADYDATNFEGSPAESYLKRSELMIAAGYVQLKEYGRQQLYTDNGAYEKINAGRARMTDLISIENPLKLIGNDGKQFPILSKEPTETESSITPDCETFNVDDTR